MEDEVSGTNGTLVGSTCFARADNLEVKRTGNARMRRMVKARNRETHKTFRRRVTARLNAV